MQKQHHYKTSVVWTGNRGDGTKDYKAYDRSHILSVMGKPEIPGSSDPAFRGDATRYNPEDMFVASVSACHMLWYLHLCAVNHIVVMNYHDEAVGIMDENNDGSGQFSEITLFPSVMVADASMVDKAMALHKEAHAMCFIARSVNFQIHHQPTILVNG